MKLDALRTYVQQNTALTEEEEAYFKRGRNLGHSSVPKHATVSDYRTATGMEALFGFLHLAGREARIKELFAAAYPKDDLT